MRNAGRALGSVALATWMMACSSPPSTDAGDSGGVDAARDVATGGDEGPGDTGLGDVQTGNDAQPLDDGAMTDGGRPRGTASVTGMVGGSALAAMDVVFAPNVACGGSAGYLIATSGTPVVCASPLAGELRQPYLQMYVASRAVGTYTLVADGACTMTTTTPLFSASFNVAGASTYDAISGSLVITASTADTISGTLQLTFADPSGGTFMGTFTATGCAP